MVKHVQTQAKLLIIILVGIGVAFLLGTVPVEAVENTSPDPSVLPKKDAGMIPLYWMIIIVGGCIAFTLSYVSWRKYKGEEKKQTKKDSNS